MLALGCFLYVLKLGDLDGCLREVGGGFSSPSRGLRKFWSVVPDRSGRGPGLLPAGLKPHFLWALTARLKAASLQNNIKTPPLQSNIKIPSGRRTWNPGTCRKRKERATRQSAIVRGQNALILQWDCWACRGPSTP